MLSKVKELEKRTKIISTPEYVYKLNYTTKTANKEKNIINNDEFHFLTYDFSNISKKIRKKYQIHEQGYKVIAGKNCKVFRMLIENSPTEIYIWNKIPLKWKVYNKGLLSVTMATKITRNPVFDEEEFKIPEHFKINQ